MSTPVFIDGRTNAEFDGEGVAIDRRVKDRAAFLAKTRALDYDEAIVVAYSELGFSASGIAARELVDVVEGTVKKRLGGVAARYGPEAVRIHPEGTVQTPIRKATPEEIRNKPPAEREWWANQFRRYGEPETYPVLADLAGDILGIDLEDKNKRKGSA